MLLKSAVFTAISIAALSSSMDRVHARGREGHGGVAIVCRDGQGIVTDIELLDLAEGREYYRFAAGPAGMSTQGTIDYALGRLSGLPVLQERVRAELDWIRRYSVPLTRVGRGLPLTTDFVAKVIPDPGCKFELLASYEYTSMIYLNRTLTHSPVFRPYQRAALELHEAIYRLHRVVRGVRSSDDARRMTALVLSAQPTAEVLEDFGKEFGGWAIEPWIPRADARTSPRLLRTEPDVPLDVRIEVQTGGPVRCSFFATISGEWISRPIEVDSRGLKIVLERLPRTTGTLVPSASCTGPASMRAYLVQHGTAIRGSFINLNVTSPAGGGAVVAPKVIYVH